MSTPQAFPPGVYVGVLAELPGIGQASIRRAVERLGGVRAAWEAPPEAWQEALGGTLTPQALQSLRAGRTPQALRRLHRSLAACGAVAITPWDADGTSYPLNLRHVPDPPVVLYVRGTLLPEDRFAVAIVGSRRASPDGRLAAGELARELASRGYTIVSGLAAGIDAAAHRGAMQAGGRTIGVLGCGIDRVYPAAHRALFEEVVRHGALVSEYPPGTRPDRWRFAARNRVIAGLSLVVVVAEAREKSGAISTAELADELSREGMAMPGRPLSETAKGSNGLLRDGAGFCADALDAEVAALGVLARLRRAEVAGLVPGPLPASIPPLPTPGRLGGQARQEASKPTVGSRDSAAGPNEGNKPGVAPDGEVSPQPLRALYSLLRRRPAEVEELVVGTGLPAHQVLSYMTRLEAAGKIRRLQDGRWAAGPGELK